jgi:hypothetical protein
MFYAGDYTFFVRICNTFDPCMEIDFTVERYHHLNYFSSEICKSEARVVVVKDIPTCKEKALHYKIVGGDSLSFPMYFTDEYLILSISGKLENLEKKKENYKISLGTKAKIYPGSLGAPIPGTSCGNGSDDFGNFYKGGAWSITPNQTDWAITIRKFGPDPEDDDVIIGPDPPE